MFKYISQRVQVLILFLFVSVSGVLGGTIALGVLHHRDNMLSDVKSRHLPLSNIIAEMSAQQITQVLRYNEILLFARTGNRERLEISNEAFINAGKQFVNIVIEGENIAQKGVEHARSAAERKTFGDIKTQLSELEKVHTDLQYQSSIIVRSIYQHDFLNRAKMLSAMNNPDQGAAQVDDSSHHMFIEKMFSRLEDETKLLENLLKNLRRTTESLPSPTFRKAASLSSWAWSGALPLLVVSFFGGLGILIIIWMTMESTRKKEQNTLREHSSALHDTIDRLADSARVTDRAHQEISNNQEHQISVVSDLLAVPDAAQAHAKTGHMAVDPRQTASEALVFAENARQTAGVIIKRMQNLRKSVREAGHNTEELQKLGEKLNHLAIQIGVLATNASAEASKSADNSAFVHYADELRDLSKVSSQTTEHFKNLLLHLMRVNQENIEATRYAENRSDEIRGHTEKLEDRSQVISATLQEQSERLQHLTMALSTLVDDMMSQHNALEDAHGASEKSVKHAEEAIAQVFSLGKYVGDRRLLRKHQHAAGGEQSAASGGDGSSA